MTSWNKGKGKGIQWIRNNASHVGEACLPWPLSRDDKGHAIVGLNGRVHKAARLMCEQAHGPAPTPKHETAHSCGRGHEGCMNPQHLSWKTRAENQQDRRIHGTMKPVGTARSKLTPNEIEEIRSLNGKMTHKALAARFNTVPSNISKIISGARWQKTPPWLRVELTQADLVAIRAAEKIKPRRELAEQYGIDEHAIRRIQMGRAYGHVRS